MSSRARARAALHRAAGAFLAAALTSEERSRLTIHLYNAHRPYRELGDNTLEPWERSWFARRLPPPPARVLIGACGDGREAKPLLEEGFEVDAFEPAAALAGVAARRLAGRGRVASFRYEDLSRAVLDGAATADGFAKERYEAVILGAGSLTHMIDAGERRRLVRALDRLCPRGPILASFWRADQPAPSWRPPGRLARGSHAIGRAVARARGIREPGGIALTFGRHYGFAYAFDPPELGELASLVGRSVIWEDHGTRSPHVTFPARP